jgi:hypothetical protein
MKKYYAIDAGSENYLSDTIYQENSTRTGTLLYSKKSDALECLEEMESICKHLKRKSTYTLNKVQEMFGPVIIDGVWYERFKRKS